MSKRNPYLLLSLDYGASLPDAKRAFARAARELKRGTARKSFERADLSWALNEIEHEIADPEAHVQYLRVPGNPKLYESHGVGLLNPGPYLPPRETLRSNIPPNRNLIELPDPIQVIGEELIEGLFTPDAVDPYPMLQEEQP